MLYSMAIYKNQVYPPVFPKSDFASKLNLLLKNLFYFSHLDRVSDYRIQLVQCLRNLTMLTYECRATPLSGFRFSNANADKNVCRQHNSCNTTWLSEHYNVLYISLFDLHFEITNKYFVILKQKTWNRTQKYVKEKFNSLKTIKLYSVNKTCILF